MAGHSPKCPSCSRGAAGAQGQKVTGWPHWSQSPVACSQALDRQAAVGSLGSSLASTVTSTARLLGAAAGSHAQNTAVWSEKGVRLAKMMLVGPCIAAGMYL